ncbi:hypothetical protein PVAR5_8790 [Paecilomyces variotii No. 5]|uniref:Class I glutamine amidotransferase-like protein n=1 Tax=Byssochlamys spectabilis (strain No. 5 / NBRC 109023) TaxID=1356009 RepID=V5FPS6_BYSSN|nr:hypothetical protein PVAR5_8790 [Paecilomyces variotii No. 5]
MGSRRIHVAVLDTDVPVPRVYAARGLYSSQFRVLLQAAAARLNASGLLQNGPLEIETTAYDIVGGVLPPLELLRTKPRAAQEDVDRSFGPLGPIDAILITGSSASAYSLEMCPWIVKLQSFIHTVYDDYPEVKIFGSCFGHQIVAQALLSHHNPRFAAQQPESTFAVGSDITSKKGYVSVAACPLGYEVGVFPVSLQDEFVRAFPPLASLPDGKLRIQLIHGDRVMALSEEMGVTNPAFSTGLSLPTPWINIGSTEKCPIQGLYYPARILTYQGHFEFDTFVNRETCIEFGRRAGWPAGDMAAFLDQIGMLPQPGLEDDDDSKLAAEIVLLFLADENGARDSVREGVSGDVKGVVSPSGLITPPLMDVR